MSESKWNFRLAEPKDAEDFSRWAATNGQIDPKDLLSGMQKNNPTVQFFVVEKDGVPITFAPVYVAAMLAHLGINPDARGADVLKSLDVLTDGVMAFMVQFGVREINTLTKPAYGMAKWAARHGFEQDDRLVYRLDINKQMAVAPKAAPDMCQESV